MINNKELKIIATIGPSSLNKKTISKMDQSGVDIFRINLSHTELKDFEKIIKQVRKWTLKPVCPDTEGAQIRTGIIKDAEGILKVEMYENLEIIGSAYDANKQQLQLNIPNPEKILKVGDLLQIDFKGVLIKIIEIQNKIYALNTPAETFGGGPLFGVKGLSIVGHGRAHSSAISRAIDTAKILVKEKFITNLNKTLQEINKYER